VTRLEGGILFDYYPSLPETLKALYPNYQWDSERFAKPVPRGYWANPANHYKLLEEVGKRLGVKQVHHSARYIMEAYLYFSYRIGIRSAGRM
jgi:hypothetical protein